MEIKRREQIYDRLYAMSMKMEIKTIPDPRYINEKLGQCHILIEEVEKFFIEVSKEMSIIQRAFNNALAGYESARDNLIATDPDIMALPSLRDREARTNLQLKKELYEIKAYKNDLVDLDNLQKAINVKIRNLGRLNMDIKIQLRLMDSQIKLGTPPAESYAARSLAEELGKSTMGLDVFNGAETTVEKTTIVDPTVTLDVGALLVDMMDKGLCDDIRKFPGPGAAPHAYVGVERINDVPIQETPAEETTIIDLAETFTVEEEKPEERSMVDQLLNPLPTDPVDDLSSCMPVEGPVETGSLAFLEDTSTAVIDLDKILSSEPSFSKVGGEQKSSVEKTKISTESNQKKTLKDPNEIDIEALLSRFK